MSVARPGANVNLLAVDLATMAGTRLTDRAAIDTAACYSPDGQTICFESDREGHPQLFLMDARGGPAQRISSGTGTYGTPAWSPRGDAIAFVKRVEDEDMLGLMGTDGSSERILTRASPGAAPTFAPGGQALMFFRAAYHAMGSTSLFAISLDGRHEFRLPTPGDASDPDWSMRST
jgi:TolB protein